jgi:hypothetical protein
MTGRASPQASHTRGAGVTHRQVTGHLHEIGSGLHHLITGRYGPYMFGAAVVALVLILSSRGTSRR